MRPPPIMSRGRLLGAYVAEARLEALRILRAPEFFVPVVILPLAFYLLIGVALRPLWARQAGLPAHADIRFFLSFAIYGAGAVGLVNISNLVAVDRSQGLLALKRAQPLPPGGYALAKLAVAVGFQVTILALLGVLATTVGGMALPAGRLLAVDAVMVLGVAPIAAIGFFIAAHLSVSATSAMGSTLFVAMMLLGGLFYPLPGLLGPLEAVWPAYHLQQLGLAAAGLPGEGDPWASAAALAATTSIFAGLAARRLARGG